MARRKTSPPRSRRDIRTETGPTWWDEQTLAVRHGICLAVLLAVSFGFFAPIVFSSESLIGGDIVQWRGMAEAMIEYREETGRPALWAPNAFAGMPGYMISYATEIPQADSVVKLVDRMIRPVAHLFVLFAGMYLLIVLLARSHWGGVVTAIAFGLTTYLPVILVAGHNSKFYALCYAPWLLLAFIYAIRKPKLLSALLFAAALAVNLRAGHVQITYYATFLAGVWWIAEGIAAMRQGRLKAFGISTAWLALGAVLGLLMVAQPYLANAEYKDYTIRGATTGGGEGGLDWNYAMSWSQGWGEFVTLLIANAYGGGAGTYWGPKPFTAGPHYVGGIVILFAILALILKRTATVWAMGVAGILMIFFAAGEFFPAINQIAFDYLPLFNAFRVPETWLAMVALVLAVLAGIGLADAASDREGTEADPKRSRAIYGTVGGLLLLVLILFLGRDAFFGFEREGEYEQLVQQVVQQRPDLSPEDPQVQNFLRQEMAQRRDERVEMFSTDAIRTLIFLLLAGAVLAAIRKRKVAPWMGQVAIACLVLIDLWGVGRRHINADALAPAQEVEDLIATYDFDRFLLERQEEEGDGSFRVLSLEGGNPMTNARPSYHHESIGGYHGAKLRLYQDYIDQIFFEPESGQLNIRAVDMLNTRYVVASGAAPGMNVVYESEQTGLVVLENPNAVPRGYFVGETEVVTDAESMRARLRNPDFDLDRKALLSEPIDFETTSLEAGATEVELLSHSPREIQWRVRTDAPRLFVASEIFYPAGWDAFVGDEQVPIHRANYLLRAVPIPEGEHSLTMRFEPRSHVIGVWVTGIATLLVYGSILAFVILTLVNRRRDRQPGVTA